MQLIIGNKNYSSWSMRPWVLMKALGLPFSETKLRFDFSEGSPFRLAVAKVSPAGKVPVLVDDGFAVWDTLAITEYLHEQFPQAGVWPVDAQQRARARCLAAEMHSGFADIRNHCPMNIEADQSVAGAQVLAEQAGVRANLARVDAMWSDASAASGGPFMFGAFGGVDAMYAPMCMRVLGYGLPLSVPARRYVDAVAQHPAVQAWMFDARQEADFLDFDEPYRKQR
jgi:glutathione S-transferase